MIILIKITIRKGGNSSFPIGLLALFLATGAYNDLQLETGLQIARHRDPSRWHLIHEEANND